MSGFVRTVVVTRLARGGHAVTFAGRALRDMFRPPFELQETARQVYELGWRSLPLIAAAGYAVGIVMSMHTRASLERFGAEALVPAGLALALVRETGPLVCGLLLSGRVGAGVGAELGAMKVTEQIDALEAVAVDSFKFLVVTRVVACMIAMPILTAVMNFMGMLGGWTAESAVSGMGFEAYFRAAFSLLQFSDYVPGDAEDDGLRVHHRGHRVVSRRPHLGRHAGGGPRGDPQRRHRVDPDDRSQRGAGAPDLLHLSGDGGVNVSGDGRMNVSGAGGVNVSGSRDANEPAAAIRLDHVSKAFGTFRVLDDVSIRIPRGRATVVLGRSGTGKSVTLRHIVGLLQPDSGRVFVDDTEVTALSPSALAKVRQRIGFLFQNAALFDSITVAENVAFPLRRHSTLSDGEIRARALEKLAAVGLARAAESMPGALSGGMRKRAGLARAMALDPAILLVDEPSAGLDPVTSEEIDDLLVQLKHERGTTLVVVTHNIPSARRIADTMLFLHEGRVLARGTAADLERSEHELVRKFMTSEAGG